MRGMSPTKSVLAGDSARLQDQIHRRLTEPSSRFSPPREERIAASEVLKRRVEEGRSPLSGLAEGVPDLSADIKPSPKPEDFTPEKVDASAILQSAQRINARILEAWINNTITDAEHLEIPGALAKSEYQQPLSRYGVDRHSLAQAGVSNSDINRIYKALFVYSLGFYQLINKTMEHIDGKYTYIAGVWKVFSILLEYCCKVDYCMMITAVQEEKRIALEQCEAQNRSQIAQLQEKNLQSQQEIDHFRQKLGLMEHELQQERHKREDMEEEVNHRGSGHEEEVELRIKFETKLNQMFARQRDLDTKLLQMQAALETANGTVEEKNRTIKDLSNHNSSLNEAKIALEGQVSSLEDRILHIQRSSNSLEARLRESTSKIESLKAEYTGAREKLQIAQSDLLQRTLVVDRLESEKNAIESRLAKVLALVEGAQREKEQALARVATLEVSLKTDLARFMEVEQDYVRIKEDESTKDKMLIDFRSSSERYFAELQRVTSQLDSLKVLYEHQTVLADQQKDQIALAVARIDEATRARKLAEDRIEELRMRLEETTVGKDELTTELASGKREVDKIRSQMAELERETEVLEMKRRTSERQFETQKESMTAKVKNLTEILNAERKVRENWIEKFESEQKSNSDNLREMMEMRRQTNDLQMQLATMTSKRDETLKRLDAERMHAAEARSKANQLKNKVEEAERKSVTLGHLVEQMEEEWGKKLQAAEGRHQAAWEDSRLVALQDRMVAEDYRSRAEGNLRNCYFLQETIEMQRHALEKIRMSYEDLLIYHYAALNNVTSTQISTASEQERDLKVSINSLQLHLAVKEEDLEEANTQIARLQAYSQSLRSKIPDEFMDQPHPIESLLRQIRDLESTIDATNKVKLSRNDREMQTERTDFREKEAQTDLGRDFFESHRPKSRSSGGVSKPGTPRHHPSASVGGEKAGKAHLLMENPTFGVSETLEKGSSSSKSKGFGHSPKSEVSQQSHTLEVGSKQSNHSKREAEDPTPIILRSVYRHDSPHSSLQDRSASGVSGEALPSARDLQGGKPTHSRLPSIHQQPRGPPPDIKSYIRQAVSRRKDDFEDLP